MWFQAAISYWDCSDRSTLPRSLLCECPWCTGRLPVTRIPGVFQRRNHRFYHDQLTQKHASLVPTKRPGRSCAQLGPGQSVRGVSSNLVVAKWHQLDAAIFNTTTNSWLKTTTWMNPQVVQALARVPLQWKIIKQLFNLAMEYQPQTYPALMNLLASLWRGHSATYFPLNFFLLLSLSLRATLTYRKSIGIICLILIIYGGNTIKHVRSGNFT